MNAGPRSKAGRREPERLVIDPYYWWYERTNGAYYFRADATGKPGRQAKRFLPVILELKTTAREFARGAWGAPGSRRGNAKGWKSWLRIPPTYVHPPEGSGLENTRICSAAAVPEFFEQVQGRGALSKVVARVGLGLPVAYRVGGRKTAMRRGKRLPDRTVVTAVIDDGIAFAHERLRRPDRTTRLEFFWNQDDVAAGTAPPGYPYGGELIKSDIDALLSNCSRAGLVDEDLIYRQTGHLDFSSDLHKPVGWRLAHGTHVMDLACGYDPASAPDNRPVIAVQLPLAAVVDTSGGTLAPYVVDALRYIIRRADALAPPKRPPRSW